MTPAQEAAAERKCEAMLRGHRQAPNGRNFLAFTLRYQNNEGYKGKFDKTFNGAPGSEHWFESKYCGECGKTRGWCECQKKV